MLQEHINGINSFLDNFEQVLKLEVISADSIILHWDEPTTVEKKEFSSAEEMIIFAEKNLK
tara:strand:- start:298 stop:480 length:183 start_codon:yes stop_codon:yes gene_type:complete